MISLNNVAEVETLMYFKEKAKITRSKGSIYFIVYRQCQECLLALWELQERLEKFALSIKNSKRT